MLSKLKVASDDGALVVAVAHVDSAILFILFAWEQVLQEKCAVGHVTVHVAQPEDTVLQSVQRPGVH
jgi:hypothetical protein